MSERDRQLYYVVTEGTALRIRGKEIFIPGTSSALENPPLTKTQAREKADELNKARQTGDSRLVPVYGTELAADSALQILVDNS